MLVAADAELQKFQGTWNSVSTDDNIEVTVTKDTLEFHDSKTGEWYKAQFEIDATTKPKSIVATIKDCPFEEFIGESSHGVYRFHNGELEISACRPGEPEGPKGFDDPRCRSLMLKRP